MKKFITYTTALTLLALLFSHCKQKERQPSTEIKKAAINNYCAIVYANYSDVLTAAQTLKSKIDSFVSVPTQASFDEAKQAWLAVRVPYGQTEVYRFVDGPIDDENGPESLLNSWPMDEAFVDYVEGNPSAGIINDLVNFPTLSKSVIEKQNESGGETNISCGFHAIEFLLWGQDTSVTSAGSRPYTDYLTVGGTHKNQSRRAQYLQICAELIVDHFQDLVHEWSPSVTGNYRDIFIHGDANAALGKMIQGMGFLAKGELAGERLEVAFDSQLQEEEHSCFSDNTHNDIRMNALGIQNVFMGSYTRTDGSVISGTGIYDVVKAMDAAMADSARAAVEKVKQNAYQIAAPFDQQILSSNPAGRNTVQETILSLKVAGDKLAGIANALGLSMAVK